MSFLEFSQPIVASSSERSSFLHVAPPHHPVLLKEKDLPSQLVQFILSLLPMVSRYLVPESSLSLDLFYPTLQRLFLVHDQMTGVDPHVIILLSNPKFGTISLIYIGEPLL